MIDNKKKTEYNMKKMREMIDRLNYLTLKYDEGNPEVSDEEWDDLYFRL